MPILTKLLDNIEELLNIYINNINIRNIFNYDSIRITDFTKTGASILTNNDELSITNSFSGELLNGRISLSSDRGYINRPSKPQQDSVLSIVKSEDCFLNVIADGAGGGYKAEIASMTVTNRLKDWFNNISVDQLKNIDTNSLKSILNNLLIKVNNDLVNEYRGKTYSTVVFSLTIGDKTLIGNIGDSTAYAYDKRRDKLIELTTLDSYSYNMSYEEARHNPTNNMITSAIGDIIIEPNEHFTHFNIVNNNIGKIILSSDGVTDLISERRFKDYFINDKLADYIVKDAVFYPSIDENIIKTADNVSAIVVELQLKNEKRRFFR